MLMEKSNVRTYIHTSVVKCRFDVLSMISTSAEQNQQVNKRKKATNEKNPKLKIDLIWPEKQFIYVFHCHCDGMYLFDYVS